MATLLPPSDYLSGFDECGKGCPVSSKRQGLAGSMPAEKLNLKISRRTAGCKWQLAAGWQAPAV
jgi:hypothetical protein